MAHVLSIVASLLFLASSYPRVAFADAVLGRKADAVVDEPAKLVAAPGKYAVIFDAGSNGHPRAPLSMELVDIGDDLEVFAKVHTRVS
jgi:hypothetical protein